MVEHAAADDAAADDHDLGLQTIYTSWKQIEQVLTDDQRAKWDAILRQSNPPASDVTAS
jgi:hypothetical protein